MDCILLCVDGTFYCSVLVFFTSLACVVHKIVVITNDLISK